MNTQRIQAQHLQSNDIIAFYNPLSTTIVDEVEWTRDGQIKVSIGYDGTGTMWFDPEEFVWILVD